MKLSHDRRMWCMASEEGVFNGHFKPTEADKINRIGQLRQGVVKVIENQSSLRRVQKIYYCRHDYRLRCC
jgi:hypothetical protein